MPPVLGESLVLFDGLSDRGFYGKLDQSETFIFLISNIDGSEFSISGIKRRNRSQLCSFSNVKGMRELESAADRVRPVLPVGAIELFDRG